MAKDLEELGKKALEGTEEEKVSKEELEAALQAIEDSKTESAEEEEVKIEPTSIEDPEPTPEEAEAIVAQKKARLAQVMTRGITNEKLKLAYDKYVPDGFGGKFVRDSEGDIIRYTNLGFGFEYKEEIEATGVHGRADGRCAIGDVVLMTITKEDLALLKEVKKEKMLRNIGAGKDEYKRRSEKHADEGGPSPIDLAPA